MQETTVSALHCMLTCDMCGTGLAVEGTHGPCARSSCCYKQNHKVVRGSQVLDEWYMAWGVFFSDMTQKHQMPLDEP
jgi:hypothetical protein